MRLFIALCLEPEATCRLQTISNTLRTNCLKGTFTRYQNLHITLAFLGDAMPLQQAKHAVAAVAAQTFAIELDKLGCFRQRDGDLYWLGVRPNQALDALYRQVNETLRAKGFRPDPRPFQPHITLGRRVEPAQGFEPLEWGKALPPVTSGIWAVTLMNSQRLHGRQTYTPILQKKLEE